MQDHTGCGLWTTLRVLFGFIQVGHALLGIGHRCI